MKQLDLPEKNTLWIPLTRDVEGRQPSREIHQSKPEFSLKYAGHVWKVIGIILTFCQDKRLLHDA